MQRLQRPQQQSLSHQKIVEAFLVIANPNNSRQLIKQADNFIKQCQLNSEFAIVLMHIFRQLTQPQQKWQILIHLNNVIKRNWTTKRRVNQLTINEQTKNKIKQGLIQLYQCSWQNYYKQFNQIFKFLSRQQFPNNYLSLKNFILSILRALAKSNIEAFLGPGEELLPYLSLVKTIYKGDAGKKFSHNLRSEQGYINHIAQPVNLSLIILQKIDGALKMLQNMQQSVGDVNKANKLLECSRKVDKIILYCFDYAVSSMQNDEKIRQVIKYLTLDKIKVLMNIRSKHRQLNEQAQKNMLAIVEGCSNLQTSLPFIFSDFLEQYFRVIISLLINQNFDNEKLRNRVIIANSKPIVTFVYFCTQAQFKQTVECKRGSGSLYFNDRKKCYDQFMSTYGGGNSIAFIEKAVTQLLDKYRGQNNQQLLFEDNQNLESASQYVSYQLILILIKNILIRFKQQLKPFISEVLSHLIKNKLNSEASSVAMNMFEIILLLPKVYDEANINLEKVLELMQNCYENADYKMFGKLIKYYNVYFSSTAVQRSFEILAQIIMKPEISHQMMYECAVCIKKLLSEHQQEGLGLEKLGPCLSNLLNLVSIYKNNPIHLWNLLQLISQILKSLSNEIVLANLPCIIQNLNYLVQLKDNDEPTINAISDLLQNLLQQIPSSEERLQNTQSLLQYLYEICMTLIGLNLCNNKMQTPSILYKLWISVAKSVHVSHCSKSLAQKLLNALLTLRENILKQDPILLLELTEQYLLGGLIMLTSENLINLAEQVLSLVSFDQNNRTTFAIFSLYLTFYMTYNTFIPKMVCIAMSNLKELQNKISQTTNILRTFLMLVINYHIIQLGPQKVFQFFNEACNNNYQQWFQPYVWSLQYLNNKYSCKVASIAMLTSLDILKSAGILFTANEQFVPLQKIMKAVSFQVEAIPIQSAIISYMNTFKMMLQSQQRTTRNKIGFVNNKGIPRKFRLHIKAQWAQCNLSGLYCQKFSPILSSLGWTSDTLDKKFDKLSSTKIIGLLTQTDNKNI